MAEPRDSGRTRRHRRRGGATRSEQSAAERATPGRAGRAVDQQSDFRPTQLPFSTAMRAREVATPTEQDLAEAAENVTLVRRHHVPPKAKG